MNGRMRVEGRVTHSSKSTPTERRYVVVMRDNEECQETMKNNEVLMKSDKKQPRTTSTITLTIVLRLYDGMMMR